MTKRTLNNIKIKISELFKKMPDEQYIKLIFFFKTKKILNLKNPQTFSEKLNWLKIHNIHPEYSDYVDKIKVRDIVKEKLGKDICFPILGIYDKYEDIEFDKLPDKFVMKNNHDSGSVNVVTDKSKLNHEKLKYFYNNRLKRNPFWGSREYPYKNIKSKILIEKYMVPQGDLDIADYKFYCFNGEPKIVLIVSDRNQNCSMDYFDMDFNHLDIHNFSKPQANYKIKKPENFEQMKDIAKILSKDIKFVRLDLYSIKNNVYFGEYTFFAGGALNPVKPKEYEYLLGSYIDLN